MNVCKKCGEVKGHNENCPFCEELKMSDLERRIEILERAIENLMIAINNLHKVDSVLNEKIESLIK